MQIYKIPRNILGQLIKPCLYVIIIMMMLTIPMHIFWTRYFGITLLKDTLKFKKYYLNIKYYTTIGPLNLELVPLEHL